MTETHDVDPEFLALPHQLWADAALSRCRELGAENADVRVERHGSQLLRLRDGRLEGSSDSQDTGFSVRVVHDGSWGFAAAVELSPEEAAECQWQALERAMAIIEAGNAEHTPQNHPTLFRLWAMREKASNPAAIRPAYRALTKSPAFAAADQTTQDALALIVTEAEAAQ